jgi:sulfite exporter TauE/SafE
MTVQDEAHLDRLAKFQCWEAVLVGFFGLIPFAHIYVGWQAVTDADYVRAPDGVDVGAVGLLFFGVGIAAALLAWGVVALLLFTARQIDLRQRRTLCLVVCGLNCASFPFGTALGVYGILTLTRPGIEEAFRETREQAAERHVIPGCAPRP